MGMKRRDISAPMNIEQLKRQYDFWRGEENDDIDLSNKQDLLVSGVNIKTINNESLLGGGNIEINGTGGSAGKDGISATHSWNGTILTITSASGTSSADLKGDKGDIGLSGANGKDGVDGYTPIKGVDYFDGEQGPQGEKGEQGLKGDDGEDGYTPVKGVDYWTESDINEIKSYVDNEIANAQLGGGEVDLSDYATTEYVDSQDEILNNVIKSNRADVAQQLANISNKISQLYPIGSVYMTSTNENPSSYLGGTWELIDKEFIPTYGAATVTKTSSAESVTVNYERAGHTIVLHVSVVNNGQVDDDTSNFGTIDWTSIGLSANAGYSMNFSAWTDGGNCVAMMRITYAGIINSYDVIPDNYISDGQTINADCTMSVVPSKMADEACNKFYWQRVEEVVEE